MVLLQQAYSSHIQLTTFMVQAFFTPEHHWKRNRLLTMMKMLLMRMLTTIMMLQQVYSARIKLTTSMEKSTHVQHFKHNRLLMIMKMLLMMMTTTMMLQQAHSAHIQLTTFMANTTPLQSREHSGLLIMMMILKIRMLLMMLTIILQYVYRPYSFILCRKQMTLLLIKAMQPFCLCNFCKSKRRLKKSVFLGSDNRKQRKIAVVTVFASQSDSLFLSHTHINTDTHLSLIHI